MRTVVLLSLVSTWCSGQTCVISTFGGKVLLTNHPY